VTVADPPLALGDVPFRGSAAVGSGILTTAQLRGSAWRRVFHDVYVAATVPDSHLVRIRAAAVRLPPGAVITGRSAAHLWGAELAAAEDPVEVLSTVDFSRSKGIRSGIVAADEVTTYLGVPVCTPIHTIWEIARSAPARDTIGWIDALARCRKLTAEQVIVHARRHSGERGSRQATMTMRLCDPRAESMPESKVRVILIDDGLPVPVPQCTVRDEDGHFIARVDLAWPRWRFAIEYDGQWHGERIQLDEDRRRIRALNAAGWYVYPITRADLWDIPGLLAGVRAALGRVSGA
jgi:hypothetical protein